jgi:hypothetical protein
VLYAPVATNTQYSEVAEVIGSCMGFICAGHVSERSEWDDMMDIKCFAVFFFGFATVFAVVIGTLTRFTSLCAPIWAIILDCAALPKVGILSSGMHGIPDTHTLYTTKGMVAFGLTFGFIDGLAAGITWLQDTRNSITEWLPGHFCGAAMAHFQSTACTASPTDSLATPRTSPRTCSAAQSLTRLATGTSSIRQGNTTVNAELWRFLLLRHTRNYTAFCGILQ